MKETGRPAETDQIKESEADGGGREREGELKTGQRDQTHTDSFKKKKKNFSPPASEFNWNNSTRKCIPRNGLKIERWYVLENAWGVTAAWLKSNYVIVKK